MKVALLGYGVVGQGVADIVAKHPEWPVQFSQVLVRHVNHPRDIPPPAPVTDMVDRAVQGAEVLVEATGDVDRMFPVVRDALARGVHVVTANKALVSKHFEELHEAAGAGGAMLRFEAAVGAGIPCIAELVSLRRTGTVTKVDGIINGSCNIILSARAAGLTQEQAMAHARELGALEADPSDDLNSIDAMRKLRILATLAFGFPVTEDMIEVEPITSLTDEQIEQATAHGTVWRQVARAMLRSGGDVRAVVGPVELPQASPFGAVHNERNAVRFTHEHLGDVLLAGPGAGRYATANAMVTDVLDILGVR